MYKQIAAVIFGLLAACVDSQAAGTAECVGPKKYLAKDGLQCLSVSNGCGVTIEAYTVTQHKGKPVYRTYPIETGKSLTRCQATEKSAVETYLGHCVRGDKHCQSKRKSERASSAGRITLVYQYNECAVAPCSPVSGRLTIAGNDVEQTSNGETVRAKVGEPKVFKRTDRGKDGYVSQSTTTSTLRTSGSQITINYVTQWTTHMFGRRVSEGANSGSFTFIISNDRCSVSGSGNFRQTDYLNGKPPQSRSGISSKVSQVSCEVR